MSATQLTGLVTAEEFEQMDSNLRLDLIEGELRPMPPMPGEQHGVVTMTFTAYATIYVLENDLGRCCAAETRFIVERNPDTTMGPDWAFTARNRMGAVVQTGFSDIIPDIVLEVRSPSDRPPEVQEKVNRWLRAGARLVWELNPRSRILTVHQNGMEPQALGVNDTLTGGDALPGFAFPLRRLFAAE